MNVSYARFLTRLKAFLFDYIIILMYLLFIVMISVVFVPALQKLFIHSVPVSQLTTFLLVTFPVVLYFSFFDSKFSKGSFGKRKTGLKVVDSKGARLSFLHSLGRNLVKFVPWEFGHYTAFKMAYLGEGGVPPVDWITGILTYVLIFAYILTAIYTKKKQSVYDIAVNTYVIKEKCV
ncbi:RDD family protein [Salinicoccus sp. HZC-1]|uniref:RDD family protein n=1 Tax=Salinicoccus sp. HZC-1 TaxID=3385497 RepID=UPI00398B4FFD